MQPCGNAGTPNTSNLAPADCYLSPRKKKRSRVVTILIVMMRSLLLWTSFRSYKIYSSSHGAYGSLLCRHVWMWEETLLKKMNQPWFSWIDSVHLRPWTYQTNSTFYVQKKLHIQKSPISDWIICHDLRYIRVSGCFAAERIEITVFLCSAGKLERKPPVFVRHSFCSAMRCALGLWPDYLVL